MVEQATHVRIADLFSYVLCGPKWAPSIVMDVYIVYMTGFVRFSFPLCIYWETQERAQRGT